MRDLIALVFMGIVATGVHSTLYPDQPLDIIPFVVSTVIACAIVGCVLAVAWPERGYTIRGPERDGRPYFEPNPNNPGNLSDAEWDDVGWCLLEDDMGDGPGLM